MHIKFNSYSTTHEMVCQVGSTLISVQCDSAEFAECSGLCGQARAFHDVDSSKSAGCGATPSRGEFGFERKLSAGMSQGPRVHGTREDQNRRDGIALRFAIWKNYVNLLMRRQTNFCKEVQKRFLVDFGIGPSRPAVTRIVYPYALGIVGCIV